MVKLSLLLIASHATLCAAFSLTPSSVASNIDASVIKTSNFISANNGIPKSSNHRSSALLMSIRPSVKKNRRRMYAIQPKESLFGLRSLSSNNKLNISNSNRWMKKVVFRVKHAVTILFTASMLFMGSVSLRTQASHASSPHLTSNPTEIRLVSAEATVSPSNNLDKIIQKYVEDHMFDDEKFDPFESALREAHSDELTGENPVKDIITKQGMVVEGRTKTVASKSFLSKIKSIPGGLTDAVVNWAEANTGLDPKVVRLVVAVGTVTVLPVALLYATLSFGGIFRKGMMRGEVKRYGNRKE